MLSIDGVRGLKPRQNHSHQQENSHESVYVLSWETPIQLSGR